LFIKLDVGVAVGYPSLDVYTFLYAMCLAHIYEFYLNGVHPGATKVYKYQEKAILLQRQHPI
jgi:hypothetical protein